MSKKDIAQRFLFDNTDIRGELISMEGSFAEAVAAHKYPDSIRQLLGELAVASVLLSTTLKFEGMMSLQARGDGALSLLMVECTDQKTFRALARFDEEQITGSSLNELLGQGTMAITIDPVKGNRYQGIVPLNKDSLVECLEEYFAQSVQLPTKLWLASNGEACAGMLLQSLPASAEVSADAREAFWEHISALAGTIKDEELLELNHETILTRLFHDEDVRLFDEEPVVFSCNCSRQRSAKVISSLDKAEIDSVIEEMGVVAMDCQFCSQQYRFDKEDVAGIFSGEEQKYH
ncbi:molecular chaperone Hsp33 [Endozoicomonas sp. (ex Bugula neritina AB1)]|nr:molecular chaperone Hsp33 [Endozoicomonas sp. (ex Bugula neritina AB1)]